MAGGAFPVETVERATDASSDERASCAFLARRSAGAPTCAAQAGELVGVRGVPALLITRSRPGGPRMSARFSSLAPRLLRAALAPYAAVVLAHAEALRAAGLNGQAPPNAGAIQGFVSAITDNALWLIGTIAALAFVVIGGLFVFGHTRAQDYAAKIAIGAVIIVSAPGLAA